MRSLQCALNNAVILHREEPFRDKDPQHDAEKQGAERHAQRQPRMVEHFCQPLTVFLNDAIKHFFRRAGEAVLLAQRRLAEHPGAHHGRQGQRHDGGDQDRYRQRDRKFTEQTPDDIAHE